MIIGGIVFLILDKLKLKAKYSNIDKMTKVSALKIGLFQIFALIPGVSRSGSTMIGGVLSGLSRKTAVEFSFLLAIPTIFIPSPYVTNNHQYKNAMDLVNKNAGLILEEKDLTKDNLINLIDKTLSNKEQYNTIKNNLKELGIKDSSSRIYEVLKEMIIDDKKFF